MRSIIALTRYNLCPTHQTSYFFILDLELRAKNACAKTLSAAAKLGARALSDDSSCEKFKYFSIKFFFVYGNVQSYILVELLLLNKI